MTAGVQVAPKVRLIHTMPLRWAAIWQPYLPVPHAKASKLASRSGEARNGAKQMTTIPTIAEIEKTLAEIECCISWHEE